MNRPDIEAIKARLATATPGPWVNMTDTSSGFGVISVGDGPETPVREICREPENDERYPDMELIANARTDLVDLIAYIEHLEGRRGPVVMQGNNQSGAAITISGNFAGRDIRH